MEKEITSTGYQLPPLALLNEYATDGNVVPDEEIAGKIDAVRNALGNGKVQVKDVKAVPGPAVTLYKVYPERKVSCSKIRVLMTETALDLHWKGVRVIALEDSIGIEIANEHRTFVPIRSALSDDAFRNSNAELPVAIGQTFGNKTVVFDLAKAPDLLVAGATKQGKTVAINTIVASLLYSKRPDELKLVFIDPMGCVFSAYAHFLKHYLAVLPCNDEQEESDNAIVKKTDRADKILRSLCIEMDQRYELLSSASVRNIKTYNEKCRNQKLCHGKEHRFLPYIVPIMDEYADLTLPAGCDKGARDISKRITESILRLAQRGRAVGIHPILATHSPSKNVIMDPYQVNFSTRIAVRTVSRTDSRIIIGTPGAEKLIGSGDMILQTGGEGIRLQGACINAEEISRLTAYVESCPDSGSPYCLPTLSPSEP